MTNSIQYHTRRRFSKECYSQLAGIMTGEWCYRWENNKNNNNNEKKNNKYITK